MQIAPFARFPQVTTGSDKLSPIGLTDSWIEIAFILGDPKQVILPALKKNWFILEEI